jgi:hypothetical protein
LRCSMRRIKTIVSSPLRLPPGMRRTPAMTEERCAKGLESTVPPARANQTGPVHRAAGRQDLRTRIVRRAVRAVCGPSTTIPTSAAANIPLFSASLRFAWLKVLGATGIRNFVTRSGPGFDFVCHVGILVNIHSIIAELTKASWHCVPPGCMMKTSRWCLISGRMSGSCRPNWPRCLPRGRRRSMRSNRTDDARQTCAVRPPPRFERPGSPP